MTGGAANVWFSGCGRSNNDGMFQTVIICVECFIIQGPPVCIGEVRNSDYDGYAAYAKCHPWLILSIQTIKICI